ncbi:hypothetical protein [Anabaena sp. PCC 7108]|uniref:hypothetical protein n=1 Tax=Anabaena sp. PCC 7108 TaxID=163908 RepID=UPI000346C7B1|nr:hypothetical protein [Anabaena sp. PCC 7108]
MGVFWYSKAEVVTTEPETVKKIIKKIARRKGIPPVCNLKIKGYSIFFDSDGYGCFGVKGENYNPNPPFNYLPLLFQKLLESYSGALICFEFVSPCQGQEYYFSSTWIKPEGIAQIDGNWYEGCYKYARMLWWKNEDISKTADDLIPDDLVGRFDIADIWHIPIDLERYKENMPNLYAAVCKAKAGGFDDWAIDNYGNKVITFEVAEKIGALYSDNRDNVLEDCFDNINKWNSFPADADREDFEFKLPENFPKLSKLQ